MSKRSIDAVESTAKRSALEQTKPESSVAEPMGLVGFLNFVKSIPEERAPGTGAVPASNQANTQLVTQQVPPKPPYKTRKILSGHKGWVNTITVEPDNQWFATGSNDNTIKIWDLASGKGKLTLTGHTMPIQALAISERMPYMFSAGMDRSTKCWDLEQNTVIREFHGHSTGITSLALHPTLNLVTTGCRDGSVHVWDIRSRQRVFKMKGHHEIITALKCRSLDPQIISASGDSTARFWDLRSGHAVNALTSHQFGIGALEVAANDTVMTASKDSISKWLLPQGDLLETRTNDCYVHSMALSPTQVLAVAKSNGTVELINYTASLNSYQSTKAKPIPGSLESETPIYNCVFDKSGTRLITAHSDKTVRIWNELGD